MAFSEKTACSLRYVDVGANIEHHTTANLATGFPLFLAFLTDLSCEAANTITRGHTLSDGPWQYRMIRERDKETGRGEWRRLKTHVDFDGLLAEVAEAAPGSCVEIQHSSRQDKPRTEVAPKVATKTAQLAAKESAQLSAKEPAKFVHFPAKVAEEKPSRFAEWERYRWPPFVVDSGIVHEALREQRLEGIRFGSAPKVEPMDLSKARD